MANWHRSISGPSCRKAAQLNRASSRVPADVQRLEPRTLLTAAFSFTQQTPIALPSFYSTPVVADLTNDGIADLIVPVEGYNHISVQLGNGDGTIQPPMYYPSYADAPTQVAVADLNGDGKPDLVVSESAEFPGGNGPTIAIFLGNGDGTFQTGATYAAGSVEPSIAVADFNGDSIPDIAVVDASGLSLVIGNGNGTFQPAQQVTGAMSFGSFATITAADLNADGKSDLLISDSTGIYLLLGNGNGAFRPPQEIAADCTLDAIADMNNDGVPDLIISHFVAAGPAAESSSQVIEVLLGNGNGTFKPPISTMAPVAQYYGLGNVAVADLNDDGIDDLAVPYTQDTTGYIAVYAGNRDGTFAAPQIFPALAFTTAAVVAELNGDGRPDLIASTFGTTFEVLLNGQANVTLTASENVVQFASGTALTATVTSADGPQPTGTVSFFDGSDLLASANLLEDTATIQDGALPVGVAMIVAKYGGDSTYRPSASQPLTVTGLPPTTTTTLTLSTSSASFGQPVTLTASVAPDFLGPTPTGTVIFYNGGTPISGPIALDDGMAALTTPNLATGAHNLAAIYSPRGYYSGSTAPSTMENVDPAAVIPAFSSSSNPAATDTAITFIATLPASGNGVAPTGTVDLLDGSIQLASANVSPSGTATFAISTLTAGMHSLRAAYGGDENYASAASPFFAQQIIVPTVRVNLAGALPGALVASRRQTVFANLHLIAGAGGAVGQATISLLLSAGESASDAFVVARFTGRLRLGARHTSALRLTIPRSITENLPVGDYHLLLQVSDTSGNVYTADAGRLLHILSPQVDLTGFFVHSPPVVRPGRHSVFGLLISNGPLATVAAIGTLPIVIAASPDGTLSNAIDLRMLHRRVHLAPGISIVITFSVSLTAEPYLLAILDPASTSFPNDVDQTSKVVVEQLAAVVPA